MSWSVFRRSDVRRSVSSASRRARRPFASRVSRSIAGASRTSLPLAKKSCAPAFSAITAASSPTVPEMMMNGRSSRISCISLSAPVALKFGME